MNINQIRLQRAAELKKMRVENKMSRKELSIKSGLHLCTIYRLESGDISWNIDSEIIYIETLKMAIL